ncbi:hypothetical protein D3C84_1059650 [compost metagenome]
MLYRLHNAKRIFCAFQIPPALDEMPLILPGHHRLAIPLEQRRPILRLPEKLMRRFIRQILRLLLPQPQVETVDRVP